MDVSKPRYAPTLLELCFLICSIFPEECSIPVDDLVMYMMGLNVFKHVHDMIEARHLIYDIILSNRSMIKLHGRKNNRLGRRKFDEEEIHHNVNNTSWLLNELRLEKEEYDDQYVKLLIDGRNLAKLIASKYGLLFGRETLTKNSLFRFHHLHEDYNGLSLVLKEVTEFSIFAVCPKLSLLHIQHGKDSLSFPLGCFRQLRNLRVLSLDIPSMIQPLELPRNLRTLHLKVLKLEDISWIGRLKYLEFLSISTSSLRHVPEDMKQLRNLRLLDLRESMNLVYIPPGVLSRMRKLEELYLPLSYKRWGCRGKDDNDYDCFESEEGEKINASFSEITSLSLYALQVGLQEASVFPKKTSIFKRIKRFRILMHNDFRYQPLGEGRMNKLQLTGDACDIKQRGIWDLMRRVEDLSLINVRNLKCVLSQLEDYQFPQLKKMIITKCDELEYLVVTGENWVPKKSFCELKYLHLSMLSNLKEIWYETRPHLGLFENLRQISIRFCHKLKYVFPLSMAKEVRRLKSIEILDCNGMEGVLYRDELGDDYSREVCLIEELHLYSLPKFVGFLANEDHKVDDGVINDNNLSMTTNEVSRTKIKDVISVMEMYCAFSSELMVKQLGSLRKLKIAFCDALQIIFLFTENHAAIRVVNSLQVLELHCLKNLRHIWFQMPQKVMAFQNLQHLVLSECHNLYHVFSFRVVKLMVQLKKVQISRCEKMKEIVVDDDDKIEATTNTMVFFDLVVLELQQMPNLSVFYGGVSSIRLLSLETLKLDQCNKMEFFSYSSLSTQKLERIQINGSSYPLKGDLNTAIKRLKVDKL